MHGCQNSRDANGVRMAVNKILSGRLYKWGQVCASDVAGLSYPSQSPIQAVMETAHSRRYAKRIDRPMKIPKRPRRSGRVPRYFPSPTALEVQRCFERMRSHRQRQALVCRYLDGTGLSEAASTELLGCTPRNYWALLHRAHKTIAHLLNVRADA